MAKFATNSHNASVIMRFCVSLSFGVPRRTALGCTCKRSLGPGANAVVDGSMVSISCSSGFIDAGIGGLVSEAGTSDSNSSGA